MTLEASTRAERTRGLGRPHAPSTANQQATSLSKVQDAPLVAVFRSIPAVPPINLDFAFQRILKSCCLNHSTSTSKVSVQCAHQAARIIEPDDAEQLAISGIWHSKVVRS